VSTSHVHKLARGCPRRNFLLNPFYFTLPPVQLFTASVVAEWPAGRQSALVAQEPSDNTALTPLKSLLDLFDVLGPKVRVLFPALLFEIEVVFCLFAPFVSIVIICPT